MSDSELIMHSYIQDAKRILAVRPKLTINEFCAIIANYFNIKIDDLYEKNRKPEIVKVRQICYYLAKEKHVCTISALSKHFKQDHTTGMYSINSVNDRICTDPDYKNEILTLEMKIKF
jgi:chromosomal replication initiation ATPase DnaA